MVLEPKSLVDISFKEERESVCIENRNSVNEITEDLYFVLRTLVQLLGDMEEFNKFNAVWVYAI